MKIIIKDAIKNLEVKDGRVNLSILHWIDVMKYIGELEGELGYYREMRLKEE